MIKVEQCLNPTGYLNIIRQSGASLHGSSVSICEIYFFQQDNAPCHKARIAQEWFHEHDSEFSFLQWAAQSPDLNPIEDLRDEMEQAIFAVKIHDQPTRHNCGKHWSQHRPASLWNVFDTL